MDGNGHERPDEQGLSELLIRAAAKLGEPRPLPESLQREMEAWQELAKSSCKSDLQMSGPIE
ncbi:MAG TPA: hypothetical protein VNA25_07695 [Phycisphaerae bacterium]|nr:hypothetical protein [Phycisphaerae bacterium]HUT57720.1 hypothetical protein [Phycisphaerae bacterium]